MQKEYIVEKTAKGYLPFRKTWYGKQYIGERNLTGAHAKVPCGTYQEARETCNKDMISRVSVRVEGELLKRCLDAAHASCDHHVGELIRGRDTVRKLRDKLSGLEIVNSILRLRLLDAKSHEDVLQKKCDEQAKTIDDLRNEVEVLKAVDTLCKCAPEKGKSCKKKV